MSGGEDPVECPLCMEPLEIDDVHFFPCTCGYQICRFCWHRIRTDENGLCPACRKAYPEDPALYKPLTQEELHKIKTQKKQKDIQRKQKISENRKHLASVRVVQKNLVFVVGLSQRLADAEVLKKHEYFGKFGKIMKVVVNNSTSYAGSQGPSASAYVTYYRAEDALRAIQSVNNVFVDGKTLKASLGTTKYCSHFLRNSQCPKPDCMYLHELGDESASFTKEEMQQGKHQEYEMRLHEALFGQPVEKRKGSKSSSSPLSYQHEIWPSIMQHSDKIQNVGDYSSQCPGPGSDSYQGEISDICAISSSSMNRDRHRSGNSESAEYFSQVLDKGMITGFYSPTMELLQQNLQAKTLENESVKQGLCEDGETTDLDGQFPHETSSKPQVQFIENAGFSRPNKISKIQLNEVQLGVHGSKPTGNISLEASHSKQKQRDERIGLCPWSESSTALAQLIEKTTGVNPYQHCCGPMIRAPPGFDVPGYDTSPIHPSGRSQSNVQLPVIHNPSNVGTMNKMGNGGAIPNQTYTGRSSTYEPDVFNMRDWQDGLRALLPNINVSFGNPVTTPVSLRTDDWGTNYARPQMQSSMANSWVIEDPAIVSAGGRTDSTTQQSTTQQNWLGFLQEMP